MMTSDGNGKPSRFIRSSIRVWALPAIIFTIFLASQSKEFASLVRSTSYFFFLFIGLAIAQADEKHGIKINYLDSRASENHEVGFKILVGIISILYLFGVVVTNYTVNIYPYIPAALGGSKMIDATIYSDDSVYEAKIIQDTLGWIMFIDNQDKNRVVKLKSELVNRIVYK
jgi:hypothetical protein